MENESLPYNVLTGVLPECLQMDTISEILSSKLRKLPFNVLENLEGFSAQSKANGFWRTETESRLHRKRMAFSSETQQVPEIRIIARKLDEGKSREKVIWHIGCKKRFLKKGIGLKKRIASVFLLNLF